MRGKNGAPGGGGGEEVEGEEGGIDCASPYVFSKYSLYLSFVATSGGFGGKAKGELLWR